MAHTTRAGGYSIYVLHTTRAGGYSNYILHTIRAGGYSILRIERTGIYSIQTYYVQHELVGYSIYYIQHQLAYLLYVT